MSIKTIQPHGEKSDNTIEIDTTKGKFGIKVVEYTGKIVVIVIPDDGWEVEREENVIDLVMAETLPKAVMDSG